MKNDEAFGSAPVFKTQHIEIWMDEQSMDIYNYSSEYDVSIKTEYTIDILKSGYVFTSSGEKIYDQFTIKIQKCKN